MVTCTEEEITLACLSHVCQFLTKFRLKIKLYNFTPVFITLLIKLNVCIKILLYCSVNYNLLECYYCRLHMFVGIFCNSFWYSFWNCSQGIGSATYGNI